MLDSKPLLLDSSFPSVKRSSLETLQINLGYTCNQSCKHCHVNAGPNRTEQMSLETINDILSFIKTHKIKKLDLTGGAPEMNPHFAYFVEQASELGVHIIDRCNLTILNIDEYQHLSEFLAKYKIEIVASLPCYSKSNVDQQRGKGVFDESILGLKKLNALGYGIKGTGLIINLMYNPMGNFLPPPQVQLEQDYKKKLRNDFSIEFNQLFTLTNMPIMRFGSTLLSKGEFDNYMQLLKSAHSEQNLNTVMCRNLISIDWQGYVYDCDFNQMLNMPSSIHPLSANNPQNNSNSKTYISNVNLDQLMQSHIHVADHCYGCTAGSGSSCGGALS